MPPVLVERFDPESITFKFMFQGKAADSVATVFFGSRIDGDFLPSSPHKLVKETRPKPTLISMASKEGTTFSMGNFFLHPNALCQQM